MKYITLFYIFLFISHIFLGPYYIRYMIKFKKPKWQSKTLKEVYYRTLWITYITFLSIALFNEYPNPETFIIAFTLSITTTIGYYIKFQESEVFDIGLKDHIIFIVLPVIYLFFYYNINICKYKPTILTFITLIYLLSYKHIDQILYKTGKDL